MGTVSQLRRPTSHINLADIEGWGPALCRRAAVEWPNLLDDPELRADPYQLQRLHGVGFLKADAVALAVGITKNAPMRLNAAAGYVLAEAEQEGHTGLPIQAFAERMVKALGVSLPREADFDEERFEVEDDFIQRCATARAERAVANILRGMMRERDPLPEFDTSGLADDQKEAVDAIRYFPIFVLLGGPGVGKTHTIRSLLNGLGDLTVALCASTGKAAKRIEELSGRPAQTIHRLLKVNPLGSVRAHSAGFSFIYNRSNPLLADVVIVDEASMIDVRLMADLCEALQPDARLILVGDPFQLPAVGAGAVLRDLAGRRDAIVPHFELTELKRQDPALLIAKNCKTIRYEKRVMVDNAAAQDFFFNEVREPQRAQDAIVRLVSELLPKKYGVDPRRDIMVLTALRDKGALSAKELNLKLRATLNPDAALTVWPALYPGDRVIQRSNNYALDIMNGDLGTVRQVGGAALTVEFDTPAREVEEDRDEFDLDLAYALTVHKAQGSEWPVIVAPIHEEMGAMVPTAQWLYTMCSRAQRACVLVGTRSALDAAAARHRDIARWTRLAKLLQ